MHPMSIAINQPSIDALVGDALAGPLGPDFFSASESDLGVSSQESHATPEASPNISGGSSTLDFAPDRRRELIEDALPQKVVDDM